jgi:hypothetical protein
VKQEHRQYHMDRAMESFTDLADIMGIDPKMITHGGRLGIAFGARGGGGASAHYESGISTGRPVINLTHTKGAGSIAHEWAHFFDHQITSDPMAGIIESRGGRQGKRAPFASHGEGVEALPVEVQQAYRDVMHAIHHTTDPREVIGDAAELRERARTIDARIGEWNAKTAKTGRNFGAEGGWASPSEKELALAEIKGDRTAWNRDNRAHQTSKDEARRGGMRKSDFSRHASELGGYWERPHELFARAFESWAEDHLEANGRENTYLVSGTRRKYGLTRASSDEILEPYPHGADRERIGKAIGKLVQAMSTHQVMQKALARLFEIPALAPGFGGPEPRRLVVRGRR